METTNLWSKPFSLLRPGKSLSLLWSKRYYSNYNHNNYGNNNKSQEDTINNNSNNNK